MNNVTHLLNAIERGDPVAGDELLPLVYEELRKLAAQKMAAEGSGHTLQPTALVHGVLDQLNEVDATAANLVKLRYFVGLSMPEAAEAVGIPLRNAERLWAFSKSWLRQALGET